MPDYREIRTADDVTDDHIECAADCREGLYGDYKMSWQETVDKVERQGHDEDWGSDMNSPAIKHLQREVRRVLREREG